MIEKQFTFKGANGTQLPARIWLPDGEITAILQITHGMTEHIGRYTKLASALTLKGIVVAGFDLRGHGKNSGDKKVASLGENGWNDSLKDMHLFYQTLQEQFGNVPHYLMGFSLGSFLVREYLAAYDDKLEGAIIMGTGHQPKLVLDVMCAIVKGQIKKAGFDETTPLVKQLSFETYNKKFAPNRTPSDWLCSDETELDAYLNDELCRENISSGLFWELLQGMKRTGDVSIYKKYNKKTKILLISGKDDPVGDMGKGVDRVKADMEKAGLLHVELFLYEKARHDLLHEEKNGGAKAARRYIESWMIKERM